MQITTHQERNRLLAAWQRLDREGQRTVRLFAEFLSQQAGEQPPEPIPQEPVAIPRPDKESAVLALKRLKKSYPMIEADFALLEEASQLVLKKVMGATDAEVIVELETLFAKRYQQWKAEA
ncbi:MAG: Crp/Fnr family transcriptional regulator [Magnetococcales bacterium]|nr:Crp/Fnr family transcriptional regulator [Magnetococcales bacterium]